MTELLESHHLLKAAAVIAKTFRIDPITILNGSTFEFRVRLAAHNYIASEEKKEADKMKSRSK